MEASSAPAVTPLNSGHGQQQTATASSMPEAPRGAHTHRSSFEWIVSMLQPSSGERLQLQGRAKGNMRRHLLRAVRRTLVLASADLLAFWGVRSLLRGVRDRGWLGDGLQGVLQQLTPPGPLTGLQFPIALFFGLLLTGNYAAGDNRRSPQQIFLGTALAVAMPMWMYVWSNPLPGPLVHYGLTVVLVSLALIAARLILDKLIPVSLTGERHLARTLIVGPADHCRGVAQLSAFRSATDYSVLGFVDAAVRPAPDSLGSLTDFPRLLHDLRAETVLICGPLSDRDFVEVSEAALAAQCQLLTQPRSPRLFGVQPMIVWKHGQPFIELNTPAVKAQALFLKRIVDTTVAFLGLLVLAPLFSAVAILVRLDSPGPIFFASERWGQGGRRIKIWKFRTMVTDAAIQLEKNPKLREAFEREVKLVDDPRITRVGRWLRRWSIDELPQLFNVLMGEMSLVGPRPKLFGEERKYGMVFDAVLSVPPGLTGLWQVSGRNTLTYEERIALDLEYVRCCSLSFDLKLLLQTVRPVLGGVGAH